MSPSMDWNQPCILSPRLTADPGDRAKFYRSLGLSETGEDLWENEDQP
jgi:hypothetical protein